LLGIVIGRGVTQEGDEELSTILYGQFVVSPTDLDEAKKAIGVLRATVKESNAAASGDVDDKGTEEINPETEKKLALIRKLRTDALTNLAEGIFEVPNFKLTDEECFGLNIDEEYQNLEKFLALDGAMIKSKPIYQYMLAIFGAKNCEHVIGLGSN